MKFFIENHNKVNIKLDTKSLIFQCMYKIYWKEIDFREGRVYNNILNTYPCFVHFNGKSWRTSVPKPPKYENIMPVFIELMIKSKKQLRLMLLQGTCHQK